MISPRKLLAKMHRGMNATEEVVFGESGKNFIEAGKMPKRSAVYSHRGQTR
jgi:hypothetical protein